MQLKYDEMKWPVVTTNWTQSILNSIFRFPKIQSSEGSNQRLWSLCAFSIAADLNMGITLANDDAGWWKLRQMHRFLPGVGWITEPDEPSWELDGSHRNNLCTHCKTMQRRLLPFVHTYLFAEPTQNKSVGQQVLIFAKRKKQGISTLSISLPPQQYLLLSPWISCIYKILILPSIFFSDGHPPPVAEHDVLRSQLLRSNPVAFS